LLGAEDDDVTDNVLCWLLGAEDDDVTDNVLCWLLGVEDDDVTDNVLCWLLGAEDDVTDHEGVLVSVPGSPSQCSAGQEEHRQTDRCREHNHSLEKVGEY